MEENERKRKRDINLFELIHENDLYWNIFIHTRANTWVWFLLSRNVTKKRTKLETTKKIMEKNRIEFGSETLFDSI